MNKDTGGPAFPVPVGVGADEGMTLRDYFAAKAMQGFVQRLGKSTGEPYWNVLASDAYKMADAMLRARGT